MTLYTITAFHTDTTSYHTLDAWEEEYSSWGEEDEARRRFPTWEDFRDNALSTREEVIGDILRA